MFQSNHNTKYFFSFLLKINQLPKCLEHFQMHDTIKVLNTKTKNFLYSL